MWFMSLIGIVLLCGIICYQWLKEKRRNQDLTYIAKKLDEIMKQQSLERIKVVTDDSEICKVVEEINVTLDENSRNLAAYRKSQESMKKMLSNVSHDLKTPLTVVLGYLEMENLKNQSDQMQLVYQKVLEVKEMMNEFFDLAKLEARDKNYPLEMVDLAEVCRICMINFYSQLEAAHAQVDLKIPEKEVRIQSNQEALTRILNNLISNAIRYGMDGRYLGLTLIEDKEVMRIEVIDHGKGIPMKHQSEVFDRLYTLEDSRSGEYAGSGLGLSITKELVTILGGTIELTSVPYEETTFSIRLPNR